MRRYIIHGDKKEFVLGTFIKKMHVGKKHWFIRFDRTQSMINIMDNNMTRFDVATHMCDMLINDLKKNRPHDRITIQMFNETSIFIIQGVKLHDLTQTLRQLIIHNNIVPEGCTNIGKSSKKLFQEQCKIKVGYSVVEVAFTDGITNRGIMKSNSLHQKKKDFYNRLCDIKKFQHVPVVSVVGISNSSSYSCIEAEATGVDVNVFKQINLTEEFATCIGEIVGIACNTLYDLSYKTLLCRDIDTLQYIDNTDCKLITKIEDDKLITKAYHNNAIVELCELLNNLYEDPFVDSEDLKLKILEQVNHTIIPIQFHSTLKKRIVAIQEDIHDILDRDMLLPPLQLIRCNSSHCKYVQQSVNTYEQKTKMFIDKYQKNNSLTASKHNDTKNSTNISEKLKTLKIQTK